MLKELKVIVCKANLDLVKHNLVLFTWGNVSAISREEKIIVIKPSGVSYDKMKAKDMVVCDLDGKVLAGNLKPSSDTATHVVLYKNFQEVNAIVHTHSTFATIWSQAGKPLKPLGTTHADHFYGNVPCTRLLTPEEIKAAYEKNTGDVIVETFKDVDPLAVPGVLVNDHGPFAWGATAEKAVYNAVVLEEVARMNYYTTQLGADDPVSQDLLDKHYLRKHGKDAYYGQ